MQNDITASDRVGHRRHYRRDQLDIITMKRSSSILLLYTAVLIAVVSVAIVSGFAPTRHRHRPSMYSSSYNSYHQHTTPTADTQHLSRIKDRQLNYMKISDDDSLHSKASSSEIQNNAIKILSRSIPSLTLAILLLFSTTPLPANAGFGPSGGATTSSPPNLTTPTKLSVQDTSEKKLKQLIGSSLNTIRLEEFSAQLDDITSTIMNIITSEDEVGLFELWDDNVYDEFGVSESSSVDTTSTSTSSSKQETTSSSTTTTTTTQPSSSIEEREAQLKASLKKRGEKNLSLRQEQQAELERLQVLKLQIANQEKMLAKLEAQPYWFNFLAAFIGSVASTLVMHPLDTIKTRLQVSGGTSSGSGKSRSDEEGEEDDGDTKDTDKQDGTNNSNSEGSKEEAPIIVGYNIMSLYEGLGANILKEGPPSALYLGVYESVKYALLPQFGPQSLLLVYLLAGAAGETCGSIVRAPAEAIKSTVQTTYCTASEAITQVFGTSASRSNVVRAWSASIFRDVPFGAIQLAIFELTKSYILNNADIDFDSSTLLSEAIIGAFAGGCGAFLTNPTDIITTRIITQSVEEEEVDDDGNIISKPPLGVIEMGKKLYKEGGPAAFFVGWQARVGYWAPAISIFLTCYCSVRQAGVQNGWF